MKLATDRKAELIQDLEDEISSLQVILDKMEADACRLTRKEFRAKEKLENGLSIIADALTDIKES